MIRFQPQLTAITKERHCFDFGSPAFGNTAQIPLKAAKSATVEIANGAAHLGLARRLDRWLGKLGNMEVSKGNLSLEDWASRTATVFSIYIPQGYLSFKEKKHIWETNSRNVIVWLMTVGIFMLNKSDKFGTNLALNEFMRPKGSLDEREALSAASQASPRLRQKLAKVESRIRELESRIGKPHPAKALRRHQWLNRWRLDVDYLTVLKEDVGLRLDPKKARKGAFWAGLDYNDTRTITNTRVDMTNRIRDLLGQEAVETPKGLAGRYKNSRTTNRLIKTVNTDLQAGRIAPSLAKELAPLVQKVKGLGQFLTRRNIFNLTNTAVITAMIVYVVGGLAMDLVYATFAKLDPDFNPDGKNKNKKPARTVSNAVKTIRPATAPPPGQGSAMVPPFPSSAPFAPQAAPNPQQTGFIPPAPILPGYQPGYTPVYTAPPFPPSYPTAPHFPSKASPGNGGQAHA
jgi:hypothetical protein